jgi:drug/metabolite transporter (DMT)-like permease
MNKEKAIGILCGIGVVLLFSSFTLVSKLGFASALKVTDIAAIRFFVAGALLFPVLCNFGLKGLRVIDVLALTLSGGVGFALLAYIGFSMAPSSHGAVLLHGTLSLFSTLLAFVIFRQKFSGLRLFGLIGVFIGICAMGWDSAAGSSNKQSLGDLALLAASISWSTYGLIAQKLKLKPAHSAAIVAVFSSLIYLPIYICLPGKEILSSNLTQILIQVFFQGILIGAGSIFIYSMAVHILGAVETALFTAAVPCVTTIVAIFLLSEIPSVFSIVGVGFVTLGMIVAMRH